jgi:2,3-bisphosphoglycerate-independent phosphoglycerate mutase
MKKTTLLCILDGWGIGQKQEDNAIHKAHTPNYDRFLTKYPHSKIKTSGLDVGLPDGQIGNSEVGHISIGSGRIIYQNLPRINKEISLDNLKNNPILQKLIQKKDNKICHLMGLFSNGGVHSHLDHIIYLANFLAKNDFLVKIHAFLDGRDVPQKSAIADFDKFASKISNFNNIQIATIAGRYYAMDRDQKWDRTKLSYDAIISGVGKKYDIISDAINDHYQQNITDEFILPSIIGDYEGINDGEDIICANFRADRARQICSSILDPNFKQFKNKKINFNKSIALTSYSDDLNQFQEIIFPAIEVKNSLAEILQDNNLKQLRIAETEKYAHVTFFFSGGREQKFNLEDRILIPSPNVSTYDLQPEMSAKEVSKNIIEQIKSNKYDFIVVNYANPDMVGHSGVLNSAIKACTVIDEQLGRLEKEILKINGKMLITADHGNIENMIDENNNPHTAHTLNPVPLILIANDYKRYQLKDGILSDIAPSILKLMNLNQPNEMNGKNLILID